MKIALISDIHGNRWALDAVLAHAAAQRVDAFWNLGDILSGPLAPAETADRLIALGALTIRGNHERQLLACTEEAGQPSDQYAYEHTTAAHREWLRALPETARPRPDVLLCHGTPASDVEPLAETHQRGLGFRLATPEEASARVAGTGARLIVCGHTHVPRVLQANADCLIVNPGSVGLQAYSYYEDDQIYYLDNGAAHASYAVVEEVQINNVPHWQASLFRVPYDWHAAADTAARNGRPEWAHALRTGVELRR
jgi:predicted phosphodiesterase